MSTCSTHPPPAQTHGAVYFLTTRWWRPFRQEVSTLQAKGVGPAGGRLRHIKRQVVAQAQQAAGSGPGPAGVGPAGGRRRPSRRQASAQQEAGVGPAGGRRLPSKQQASTQQAAGVYPAGGRQNNRQKATQQEGCGTTGGNNEEREGRGNLAYHFRSEKLE